MRRTILLLLLSLLLFCFLSGCGEDESLTAFKENMTTFYKNIRTIGDTMEAIDPSLEQAVELMNASLDQMLQQFQHLAALDIPPQFSSVDNLADDALEYMTEAARLYSQAYENNEVNDSYIQAAGENYEVAMKRIQYIAALLQGEIPEGASIIEGEATEFEPYTE